MSRVEPGLPGSPPIVATGYKPLAPVDPVQVQDFERALKVEPANGVSSIAEETPRNASPSVLKELSETTQDGKLQTLAAQLLARFASQGQTVEQDRLALRTQIKELSPLAKQQERLLLNVLGEVQEKEGSHYLTSLIKDELRRLIPMNGMLNNLVSYSHKLDLEP